MVESSFAEWSRLNGSVNPDLQIADSLTPLEKEKAYDDAFRRGAQRLMVELRDPENGELKLVDKLELSRLKL